ncbi:hypothetical protein J2Y41_004663 [Arthrobacter sp. 1088]|nr:hypothetical protein [Arthrobacter sp. 1088]
MKQPEVGSNQNAKPVSTQTAIFTAGKVHAYNRDGNQVVMADRVDGDVRINIDASSTIHQNINSSASGAKAAGAQGEESVVAGGAVIAGALFMMFREPLMWLTIGMCCGLLITLIVAMHRIVAAPAVKSSPGAEHRLKLASGTGKQQEWSVSCLLP